MSTITLTASMRSNLSSLKTIQSQMDVTQERLSTGKKVNSAIDNASSFYQARALTNRASDLDGLLDSMGQGIQTIQAANEGIEAITSFVEQMKSVAQSAFALNKPGDGATEAETKAYADALAEYAKQFDAIAKEIGAVVDDASYQGINLLNGGELTVTFNETRSNKFKITGDDVVTKMAIGKATDGDKKWTDAASVDASIGEISKAIDYLRSYATTLGNNYSIIETRQDFTEAMIDVLETGSDKLVLADMNEESANYLALQTRQQLAVNSLALASQSAQSVLSLF